jgi:hypothetical protein
MSWQAIFKLMRFYWKNGTVALQTARQEAFASGDSWAKIEMIDDLDELLIGIDRMHVMTEDWVGVLGKFAIAR